jgi:hypothetical protein
MDYQLAKQLIDAGFPVKDGPDKFSVHADPKLRLAAVCNPPTLPELIDAAGPKPWA